MDFSGAIRFSNLNAVGTGWPALLRVHCAISAGPSYTRGEVEIGMPVPAYGLMIPLDIVVGGLEHGDPISQKMVRPCFLQIGVQLFT